MLSGYRSIVVALGLILAGAQQPTEQAKDGGGGAQQQHATSSQATTPTPTPEPTYRPYPNRHADACYQAKDHDAADLCAQWRAAIAAEKAVHEAGRATTWAIVAAFLSFITVAGLIYSIWQTNGALREARKGNKIAQEANARATRQAIENSKESRKATEAMIEANAITRQVQRPWIAITVFPGSAMLLWEGKADLGIEIILKNCGARIATDIIVDAKMYTGAARASERELIVSELRSNVHLHQSTADYNRNIVLPGETTKCSVAVKCPPEHNIYRIIVYLEYIVEGSGPFKFSWSSFDLLTQQNGNPKTINVNLGPILAKDLVLEQNGVGGGGLTHLQMSHRT